MDYALEYDMGDLESQDPLPDPEAIFDLAPRDAENQYQLHPMVEYGMVNTLLAFIIGFINCLLVTIGIYMLYKTVLRLSRWNPRFTLVNRYSDDVFPETSVTRSNPPPQANPLSDPNRNPPLNPKENCNGGAIPKDIPFPRRQASFSPPPPSMPPLSPSLSRYARPALGSFTMPTMLLFTLLVAGTEAAFTMQDNVLQGYDCSQPREVQDRTLNDAAIECDETHRSVEVLANQTYQLLVMEKVERFRGWKCAILDTRKVVYCGNYDHQTSFAQYDYTDLPMAPELNVCEKMIEKGLFTDPRGRNHHINVGGITALSYTEVGHTWAVGTNPGETSEVQCAGGDWEIDDLTLTDIVVTHNLKVYVVKEEFRLSEGIVSALSDAKRLKCPSVRATCSTAEATYTWQLPQDRCTLAVSKHVRGMLVTDELGDQVFMSTDDSLVRLILKQTESHCGRVIYSTNYPEFYLAKLPHHKPFTRFMEPESISLSTYVNNRDDYLYNYVADQIDGEMGAVLRSNCIKRKKEGRHRFYLQHADPGLVTYTLGNGTFATSAGEALYFYQCKPVMVRAITSKICYDGLPVQPILKQEKPGDIDDVLVPDLFLEPLTRRLTKKAMVLPCSTTFRMKYQLVNQNWISADPHLRETKRPLDMQMPEALRQLKLNRNVDWSQGGVYKQEELKKLEEILELPKFTESLSVQIASQVGHNYQVGDALDPSNMFGSFEDPVSMYQGFLHRVLRFLEVWGEGAAICTSLFFIGKVISNIIGWIFGGRQLFLQSGWTRRLLWTFCPTLFLLRAYGKANQDDSPPPGKFKKKHTKRRHHSASTEMTRFTHDDREPLVNDAHANILRNSASGQIHPGYPNTGATAGSNLGGQTYASPVPSNLYPSHTSRMDQSMTSSFTSSPGTNRRNFSIHPNQQDTFH